MRRTRLAPALVVLALFGAACSDGPAPDAGPSKDVAVLQSSLDDLARTQKETLAALKSQDRRLARLESVRHGSSRAPASGDFAAAGGAAEAPSGMPAGAAAAAGEDVDVLPPETVHELLATDAGRKAIQKAADTAARKQASRDRDTLVAYELARFGDEIGLTSQQTKDLQAIWKDAIDSVRKSMAAARANPGTTPEDKARTRDAVMQTMRDLGAQRTERVRNLLDDEQFALYEKREKEIDAALHGAPPKRPSAGGGDAKDARSGN